MNKQPKRGFSIKSPSKQVTKSTLETNKKEEENFMMKNQLGQYSRGSVDFNNELALIKRDELLKEKIKNLPIFADLEISECKSEKLNSDESLSILDLSKSIKLVNDDNNNFDYDMHKKYSNNLLNKYI